MSDFYVGQKVLVTGSTFRPICVTQRMVGKVCEVRGQRDREGQTPIWNSDKSNWGNFNNSDFQPINETPETLTINGVEYIRKPEPVVEHEWKFGDVATHEEYGVGIVIGIVEQAEEVEFRYNDGNDEDYVFPDNLTFIRRADLSV